jgi:hypothetical protein
MMRIAYNNQRLCLVVVQWLKMIQLLREGSDGNVPQMQSLENAK